MRLRQAPNCRRRRRTSPSTPSVNWRRWAARPFWSRPEHHVSRRVEGPAHPLDRLALECQHIEPAWPPRIVRMPCQPEMCRADQLSSLGGRDRAQCPTERRAAPVAHFNKDDRFAVTHDEVDFAVAAKKVGAYEAQAMR